jgi:hypothetical protein
MGYNEELGGGKHIAPKSKHIEVVNFFPVSVDNFFDNPDRIVRYAKSLPMKSASTGNWPGKRTEALWKIDKDLNQAILLKIMSCYYDISYQNIYWDISHLSFQEIPAFSKNKNDARNRGWIHFDTEKQFEIAGLIYLTPDIDPDSGTSLFALNQQKDEEYKLYQKQVDQKILGDEAYYAKKVEEQGEFFIETTRFANIYNRMIMYDVNEFHRANSYYSGDEKDARLTLVFFIGGMDVGMFPLERIRDKNGDEFIEHRTEIKQ